MQKISSKIFLILAFILFCLILGTLIISTRQKQIKEGEIFPTITSMPTLTGSKPKPSAPLQPTVIEATKTGGMTEKIPEAVVNEVSQERELRKKVPVKEIGFTLSFDFANDIFVVDLVEPKDRNKIIFVSWLKKNYPLVLLERFKFN